VNDTPWFAAPMLGFDCETTGVSPETDRIVTAALVKVGPEGAQPWQAVINPGIDVPEAAARIHGWTTERVVEHGRKPAEVLEVLAAALSAGLAGGTPVVGMNLSFDFTILDRELRRWGLPVLEERLGGPIRPVIDVYVLDKHVSYRKGSRKLVDTAAFYGVDLGADAHDATADTLAACRIAYKIGRNNERVGSMSIGDLHDSQIAWRAEQQASLQAYFKSQGKNEICDGSWPIKPFGGAQ
jgi:DNA polymerase III subunit epsilon